MIAAGGIINYSFNDLLINLTNWSMILPVPHVTSLAVDIDEVQNFVWSESGQGIKYAYAI